MNLIFGGSGLLGTYLKEYLDGNYVCRKDCDVTNAEEVRSFILKNDPDLVINLSGFTNVFECEKENLWAGNAMRVNAHGARNIAKFSRNLVYISTDYVFDGKKGNYSKTDRPNPINKYGFSKWFGEMFSSDNCRNTMIIRTSFKKRPFQHKKIPCDMLTTSDYIDIMAPKISDRIKNFEPGIFHVFSKKRGMVELASETLKDFETIYLKDIRGINLPMDSSLCE
jgi:dTDP-4-dehydrorhamnose reductase